MKFSSRAIYGMRAMLVLALAHGKGSTFLKDIKALLAGEKVVIEGGVNQMLHPPGFAAPRPIRTPIYVAQTMTPRRPAAPGRSRGHPAARRLQRGGVDGSTGLR